LWFCGVKLETRNVLDWDEPESSAFNKIMNIKHAVITSVDRDDLKDGGSIIWIETVKAIRRIEPNYSGDFDSDFQESKDMTIIAQNP
jgi:lipoic acid synthetase